MKLNIVISKSRFPRDGGGFRKGLYPEREKKHIWIFPSFSRSRCVMAHSSCRSQRKSKTKNYTENENKNVSIEKWHVIQSLSAMLQQIISLLGRPAAVRPDDCLLSLNGHMIPITYDHNVRQYIHVSLIHDNKTSGLQKN